MGTVARERRILFPVVLCVHAPTLDDFRSGSFAGSLQVVTGHCAIYGWYVSMFEALNGQDFDWVTALWQAALTVTLHAHIVTNYEALAALSIRQTGDMQQVANCLTDSFPSFARKLTIALRSIKYYYISICNT